MYIALVLQDACIGSRDMREGQTNKERFLHFKLETVL
jgi:hypothetical protein